MLHRVLRGPGLGTPGRSRILTGACLALLLGLALVLRFHDLAARGFIYWDEAKFALEGIRVQSYLLALLGLHGNLATGKAVGTAKPTHALLIALAYVILGQRDYAALYAQGFCSCLAIVLTFVLARRLFDTPTGVLAALLLGVGSYDVIYARSSLSESDAGLFLVAGVALALTGGRRQICIAGPRLLSVSGLCFGLAFTTNYRLIVYTVAAGIVMLALSVRDRGAGRTGLCALAWIAGFALPVFLWQVAGILTHGGLFRDELTGAQSSYLEEVRHQLTQGRSATRHFDPLRYPGWYVARDGVPVAILLALGLVLALWKRTAAWLVPAVLVLVPYFVYVSAPYIVPRNMATALPFAAILEAAAVVTVARSVTSRISLRTVFMATAAAIVLISSIGASWELSRIRSGFLGAVDYVRQHDRDRALTSSEVVLFYLRGTDGNCHAPAVPLTRSYLAAYVHSGYRYAIVESAHHVTPVVRFLHKHATPLAVLPLYGPYHWGEGLVRAEDGYPPWHRFTAGEFVDVYGLAGLGRPRVTVDAPPCTLSSVT